MGTKFFFILVAATICFSTSSIAVPAAHDQVTPQTESRLSHAKELLGKGYRKSVVRKSESTGDITDFVKEATRKFLPKRYRKSSDQVAQAILDSADKFHFDPVFLMAVIQNESSFNPKRLGSLGEIGLMQIKPATAEWIANRYDLDYKSKKTLLDPVSNIKIGSALLDKLRHQFESQSRLYLSAYNIGAKKVRSMVVNKKIPKEYVLAVMKRYIAMYSAFKVDGDSKVRGEIAFHNTRNLTLKKVKIALNGT